jgi:phosphatidate cytidylyltransferase
LPEKVTVSSGMSSNLVKRILSAVVLIPLVGLVVYLGGWVLFAVILLAGLLAGYEYLQMLRTRDLAPSYVFTLGLIAFFVIDAQWPQLGLLPFGLFCIPLLALVAEIWHGNAPNSLVNWALAVAGGIYIGFTLSHFIRLRAINDGALWLALALVSTWIADSGAYFVGLRMGKTPFHPKISPKKTREGAVGELVSGTLAVVLLGFFFLDLPIGWGVVLGVLVSLGATYGDLAESIIKRQVGVKDSGNIIPGHGGMLDRVDSLLFVVPIVYYVVTGLMNLRL